MDKYLDRLVYPVYYRGGYCALNEQMRGVVVEGVIEVSFNSLYPRLFLYLYDNGIFDKFDINIKNKKDDISKLRYYYDNNLWRENKLWINSIWSNGFRDITPQSFDLFSQYMSMFYGDIIANIPYDWLYIDTDSMFIVGDEGMVHNMMRSVWFPFGFELGKVPFIFIDARKRYIKSDLLPRGFSGKDKRKDEILDIMKPHIRNRKLDDILC